MSDKFTELEMLKQQRREIDERIKFLQRRTIVCGSARISSEHFDNPSREKYSLAIRTTHLPYNQRRWQTIFSDFDRQSVIKAIPGIVADLQELYESVKVEEGKRA